MLVLVAARGISSYTFTNDLDTKRVVKIFKIFDAADEIGQDLRYHFLTDQVCDCLGILNYFDVVHPNLSQHKSKRLQFALKNQLRSSGRTWRLQSHSSSRAVFETVVANAPGGLGQLEFKMKLKTHYLSFRGASADVSTHAELLKILNSYAVDVHGLDPPPPDSFADISQDIWDCKLVRNCRSCMR